MSAKFVITTPVEIPYRDIASLLCSAFEGGIGYWAEIIDYREPGADDLFQWDLFDDGTVFEYVQYPLSKGGSVRIRDTDTGKRYTLNLRAIERGLKAMASGPDSHHLAALLENRTDAITGDVFVQCCLFGESIYG